MDVVKAGNHDLWQHAPYAAEIVAGKLYGRGSTDMKGGLMALVIAMIHAKKSNNLMVAFVYLRPSVKKLVNQAHANWVI